MIFLATSLSSQEKSAITQEYERVRQGLLREFNDFRKELNREYANFLKESWQEFRLMPGEERDEEPKPEMMPVYKEEDDTEADVQSIVEELLADTLLQFPPSDIRNEIEKKEYRGDPAFVVNYYGAELSFEYKESTVYLPPTNDKIVGKLWENYANTRFSPLLLKLLEYRETMQMNDWAYVLLVKKVSGRLSILKDASTRAIFQQFLLVQSGYDARLGRVDDEIVLLLPVHEKVFETTFLRMEGVRFYVISDRKFSATQSIFSFVLPEKLKGKHHISLAVKEALRLPPAPKPFSLNGAEMEIKGEVNLNRILFLADYIPCDLRIYAQAGTDPAFHNRLMQSFKEALKGKSKMEALGALLSWVQHAFEYQQDDEQFGREKSFFVEENFYYPYTDCEDRAILFCYLVKNLLDMKVLLLDYPGHVAAAVCVPEEMPGDYLVVDEERYVICDPTYIGSGIGEAMSRCKGVKTKVMKVY